MTKEDLEKVIDFYFDFSQANNREFITFIFFGGEPFLHMDLMRHGIDYACKKHEEVYPLINIEFATDTNGTIWNDKVKEFILYWYKKSGQIRIMYSTDGLPTVNSITRPAANKTIDSGEIIDRNLREIVPWMKEHGFRENKEYRVNTVVSPQNLLYLFDSFKYYREEMGFENGLRFKFVVEANWTEQDAATYNQQLKKIFDYCVENELFDLLKHSKQFGQRITDPNPNWVPSIMCGVAGRSISVAPNRKLYPCHRRYFTNPEDYFGEIYDDGTYWIDQQKYDYYYYANHIENVYVDGHSCKDCKMKKNKYCTICINSNRNMNGLESIGCAGNCLMASIEFKWQMNTYKYFMENDLL